MHSLIIAFVYKTEQTNQNETVSPPHRCESNSLPRYTDIIIIYLYGEINLFKRYIFFIFLVLKLIRFYNRILIRRRHVSLWLNGSIGLQ